MPLNHRQGARERGKGEDACTMQVTQVGTGKGRMMLIAHVQGQGSVVYVFYTLS